MKKITFYCDVCGKEKGETNHWWSWYIVGKEARESLRQPPVAVFVLQPFDPDGDNHLCGHNCASVKQAEWMSRQGEAGR